MRQLIPGRLLRISLQVAILFLVAGYFALVAFKSPFDFTDPEFESPKAGQTQVQMIIENEPFDHFRTATVSLLLGMLVANSLLSLPALGRRRLAVAILASSMLLAMSTFFGLSPLATQPILLLVALYGLFVAFGAIRPGAKHSL